MGAKLLRLGSRKAHQGKPNSLYWFNHRQSRTKRVAAINDKRLSTHKIHKIKNIFETYTRPRSHGTGSVYEIGQFQDECDYMHDDMIDRLYCQQHWLFARVLLEYK